MEVLLYKNCPNHGTQEYFTPKVALHPEVSSMVFDRTVPALFFSHVPSLKQTCFIEGSGVMMIASNLSII